MRCASIHTNQSVLDVGADDGGVAVDRHRGGEAVEHRAIAVVQPPDGHIIAALRLHPVHRPLSAVRADLIEVGTDQQAVVGQRQRGSEPVGVATIQHLDAVNSRDWAPLRA